MAAYLWKYGLIANSTFTAEQGHWIGRPGEGFVEVVGVNELITSVRLAGEAVTVLRGEIDI